MTVIRVFLVTCCLLTTFPVLANGERHSYSLREGVFYARLDGYTGIGFDSPEKAIALRDHCESGGFVFAHRSRARYRCKVSLYERDQYGSIEIIGAPTLREDQIEYDLFSIRPIRKTEWKIRPLSQNELSDLTALIKASKGRYGSLDKYVSSGKAFAVYRAKGKQITYIIPGSWIRREDDFAYYEAQRQHVFVGSQGTYQYQGQLLGKLEYFDLDGDSLPEIEASEGCDVVCITLWDISRGPREIVRFY
ncbi:MAG: hypothetical protein FWG81_05600 [Betaproteobacteria bacterium]|nr:hypothetical protein [Betaproteobacteria bacterium]